MKDFPRIHSLSTIGLIHHQEFDYHFHPFRTDFVGESGSGKSMIADLLQLIFVGSEAFESSTKATKERPPEGLVLTQPGYSRDMGYAFLNIEMANGKFLIIGVYIEAGSKSVQCFIVQKGYEKENVKWLDNAVYHKTFMDGDNILPIDKLKDELVKVGLYCRSWIKPKKYHQILYEQKILPIDISINDRLLGDYAEILQSFSRGKTLDTQKSNSLKDFLFGKETATKIYEDYKRAIREMAATIGEYGSNLEEITRVTKKQTELLELRKLRNDSDDSKKKLITMQLLYCKQQADLGKNETDSLITNYLIRQQHVGIVYDLLLSEIEQLESSVKDADAQLKVSHKVYLEKMAEHNEISKVDKWIVEHDCPYDQLLGKYTTGKEVSAKKLSLNELLQRLDEANLSDVFEGIEHKDSLESLNHFLQNHVEALNAQIDHKKALKTFSDVKNPDSFAFWAISQKRSFSLEEESAIIHFQKLPRKKPTNRTDYLPSPEEFISALKVVETDENGFWITLAGVRKYVLYIAKQVFDTADENLISDFFSTYSSTLDQEINSHSAIRNSYTKLQNIILNLSKPLEALLSYNVKEEIIAYKITEMSTVGEVEFKKALENYGNKSQIEKAFSEAESSYNNLVSTVQKYRNILAVYKMYKIPTIPNSHTLEYISNNETYAEKIRETSENYEIVRANIVSTFAKTDKIAFIEENLQNAPNDLNKGSEIQSSILRQEELEKQFTDAKEQYRNIYGNHPDNLDTVDHISGVSEYREQFIKAEGSYTQSFNRILQTYIPSEAHKLDGENNFRELAKKLLPEAFHNVALNDATEEAVVETIENYLNRINDKNRQLNSRKIQKIKDLLLEVDVAVSNEENIVRRIDNFLKSEGGITGGYKARLKKKISPLYTKEWMMQFQNNLEAATSNFTDKLAKEIDMESMIRMAFAECGGNLTASVTAQKLLDPSIYYDLEFVMESSAGRVNLGSTGQTYAAITLLCVARLSVLNTEEGKNQRPALRVMPIDEAEGLGSNYDMLYDIAKTYDYQLLSLSVSPVGKFKENEQYLYILQKNMETEAPVNYTPMAILSEADKVAE